ncbi:unnamed protein product, partial [marine sediment metagenome]
VTMYMRVSSSRNDILTEDWIGPYTNDQSSGLNISHMVGQFLQFRAVLRSREKGITPTLHKVIVQVVATESVHFFTTNFALDSNVTKGILTSQKVVPVSADVVFGLNTTNSVDWTEYQIVDENRVFDVSQLGENIRLGIKLISPSRSILTPSEFEEYGPYSSGLFINTVDFDFTNTSGVSQNYHFKITLYEDIGLGSPVFVGYSYEDVSGFNVDGSAITSDGVLIDTNETVHVLFTVPGTSNIRCDTYYYVQIESINNVDEGEFELILDDYSFVAGCSSSFIDVVDFNFVNNDFVVNNYHFRIKFYEDPERTNEFLTAFSGNDRSGWTVNNNEIPENGVALDANEKVNVIYRPNLELFNIDTIYYLTIDTHNSASFVFASSSYTFQINDLRSLEYCGEYMDVPIVKNFGTIFELNDNSAITLNN